MMIHPGLGWLTVTSEPQDMRKLVIQLAREMVDHPDAVDVQLSRSGNSIRLVLRVERSDLARITGERGRTAAR